MGLFSSKKKIVVGTSVVRVIEDKQLPDSIRTGLTNAIFQNGEVVDNILEELVGSIGVRADRAYEYAAKHYTHGLPASSVVEASKGRDAVSEVLQNIEGQPVLLNYCFYGPPNPLHLGWMQLIQRHGYNPQTNKLGKLSAEKGKDVFLDDMQIVIPMGSMESFQPGALEQWGTSPKAGPSPSRKAVSFEISEMVDYSPILSDSEITEDVVRITYAWEEEKNLGTNEGQVTIERTVFTEKFDIPITEALAASNFDYFHAKYTVNGSIKYALYRVGSGSYPTLDKYFDIPAQTIGSFYPFAYFRYDKVSELDNKNTDSYKTTKKLTKYFGMDFDEVAKAINENPDIKDVQQAMMIMAVPANTKEEVERKYLYKFFDNWFYSKDQQFRLPTAGLIAARQTNNWNLNRSSIIIQDKRFKMALSTTGLFKRRVAGSIGAIGTHDSGITDQILEQVSYNEETGDKMVATKVVKNHYYRKQISLNFYDEIVVNDLQMLYHVYGEYTATGDETDDILLIPLDRAITNEYSITEKETLYARSLHFVFNSMRIIKIKWYQQGWFSALIKIVGFIIAVITLQPQIAAWAAAIAGGTSAAISAALWALMQKLLQGLIIGFLFKLFVKVVGTDLAFLIALVAAAYGAYEALETGSIAGAPWATELLQLSNGLTKAITSTIADAMSGLKEAYDSFSAFREEASAALDKANELLETNNHLSPFAIFGESPNDFYNRTVHAGNTGTNAIQAISSYVDMALTLPKLKDTLGEEAYELSN